MNFREHYFIEKFGMESIYTIPKDKEQQLFDFYALTMFNPNALMDEEAQMFFSEAKEKIIDSLQKSFIDALYTAIAAELTHTLMQAYPFYYAYRNDHDIKSKKSKAEVEEKFTPEEIKVLKNSHNIRSYNYDQRANFFKEKGYTPEKLYILAKKVFDLNWSSSFGGKKWKEIAVGLERLINAKSMGDKMVAIDHAYDLQHNNDTVFNKVKEFAKHGSYEWLKRALDLKAQIKEPHVYLDNISSQLYRPMAYALKQIYGKTLESFLKQKEEEKQKFKEEILEKWPNIFNGIRLEHQAKRSSIQYNVPVSIFIQYDFDKNKLIDSFYVRHSNKSMLNDYRNSPDTIEVKVIKPEEAKQFIIKKATDAKKYNSSDYNKFLKGAIQAARSRNSFMALYYNTSYNNFGFSSIGDFGYNNEKDIKPGFIALGNYVIIAIVNPDGSIDEI